MARSFQFTDLTKPIVKRPWLLFAGPSGSGKTRSALRLMTGQRRVVPGGLAVIDTEGDRALEHRPFFEFEHLRLEAPYPAEAYLEAVEFCVSKGARYIIVDSLSHEHEGPGGYLDQHAIEMGDNY